MVFPHGLNWIMGTHIFVLGIVVRYQGSKEALYQANQVIVSNFGLGFFNWGLILFAGAALAAIIVLLVYARKIDLNVEKNQRRSARLAAMESSLKEENEVVEANE